MKYPLSLRNGFRTLLASLWLCGAGAASATDVYNGVDLSIPSVTIGNATYTNMVVAVDSIVSGPAGSAPNGSGDTYDPVTNHLTIPAVSYLSKTYYNVVISVKQLVSVQSVSGADSYDGKDLTIAAVRVGAKTYTNVVVAVAVGNVVSLGGGMPQATQDHYDVMGGQLTANAVQVGAKVYTNVTLKVGLCNIVSVGGIPYVNPACGSSPLVTTQPASQTVVDGTPVTFTAGASGSPAPSVQWQQSSDAGVTFTSVPGASGTSLTFTAAIAQSGSLYRAVFTNAAGATPSSAATLIVIPAVPLPTYHLIKIASPVSGYGAEAVDVNDNNVVVGSARNGSANPASYGFYWTQSGGAVTDGSLALAVTSAGEVVIQYVDAYSNVQSTLLDPAFGSASGTYQSGSSGPTPSIFSPTGAAVTDSLYWSGPTQTTSVLPGPPGASAIFAEALNAAGQIVGYATTTSSVVPVYWPTPTTLPVGMQGAPAVPTAISSDAKIVGAGRGNGIIYYWPTYTAPPLTIALANNYLIPVRVNKDGVFVGQGQNATTGYAMVGTAATGPVDLATRLDSSGANWTLDYALAINDKGAIVGYGTAPDGTAAGFIAIPN
jgi:hypothetical protein